MSTGPKWRPFTLEVHMYYHGAPYISLWDAFRLGLIQSWNKLPENIWAETKAGIYGLIGSNSLFNQ